jgi:hypothetical protein
MEHLTRISLILDPPPEGYTEAAWFNPVMLTILALMVLIGYVIVNW